MKKIRVPVRANMARIAEMRLWCRENVGVQDISADWEVQKVFLPHKEGELYLGRDMYVFLFNSEGTEMAFRLAFNENTANNQ